MSYYNFDHTSVMDTLEAVGSRVEKAKTSKITVGNSEVRLRNNGDPVRIAEPINQDELYISFKLKNISVLVLLPEDKNSRKITRSAWLDAHDLFIATKRKTTGPVIRSLNNHYEYVVCLAALLIGFVAFLGSNINVLLESYVFSAILGAVSVIVVTAITITAYESKTEQLKEWDFNNDY